MGLILAQTGLRIKALQDQRKASEIKPHESGSAENRAAESKGHERKTTESGERSRASENKPAEHKPDHKTGESKPTTHTGEKTNAASEPKSSTSSSHGQSEPPKSSAESTPSQGKEQNRATAPSDSTKAPSSTANTGGTHPNPAGAAGANQTGNAAGATRTGAAGSATSNAGASSNTGSQTGVNASANIEPQQRSKIVETLRSRHSEAETNVNFSVSVGAIVPEHVHYRPLPEDIVSIAPQYRGYNYVMVRDEVVIIEPRTRKIVTVIQEGGSTGTSARRSSIDIPVEKRRRIHTEVIRSYHGPRDVHIQLRVGERVPDNVTLETFPATIYSEDPDLRSYEYVVVQEEVALVDPQSRQIVEILD
jgi:hypothetical protein